MTHNILDQTKKLFYDTPTEEKVNSLRKSLESFRDPDENYLDLCVDIDNSICFLDDEAQDYLANLENERRWNAEHDAWVARTFGPNRLNDNGSTGDFHD